MGMTSQADLSLFPVSTTIQSSGHLAIDGQDLARLADQYGTPLYVYDAQSVLQHISRLEGLFKRYYPGQASIAYAAKAYFGPFFAKKMALANLGVDVVSLAELGLALQAGFPPERIHLHGSNKSQAEIEIAIQAGIQAIVIDSLDELEFLEGLLEKQGQQAKVWLRITPDIDVSTHPHISTGHLESKFGLHIQGGEALQAIQMALSSPRLHLTGLHMHLGSQITQTEPYRAAIKALARLAAQADYTPLEISPGGGWGVRYQAGDPNDDPEAWVQTVSGAIQEACIQNDWLYPKVVLEPGRWLVAQAGVAIYQVGAQKVTPAGTHLLAVDGGLADNPRVALYQAGYSAAPLTDPLATPVSPVTVVGRYCESGDVLLQNANLPAMKRGDYLAVPVAGAYQLSMASNYNLAPRPAVLWLENGQVQVMHNRERLERDTWWQVL